MFERWQNGCGTYIRLCEEALGFAYQELGRPYLNHYANGNQCQDSTRPECMSQGMDPRGYDCTGLVIGSLCLAFGLKTRAWPSDYRHCRQLQQFSSPEQPKHGDIVIIESTSFDGRQYPKHAGFCAGGSLLVHTDGAQKRVAEGVPLGNVDSIEVVDVSLLLSAVSVQLTLRGDSRPG